MTTTSDQGRLAVLDEMHAGDICGALGTIRVGDTAPRLGLPAKLKTLWPSRRAASIPSRSSCFSAAPP